MTDINKAIIDITGDGKSHKNEVPQTPGFDKICEKLPRRNMSELHHPELLQLTDLRMQLSKSESECSRLASRVEELERLLREVVDACVKPVCTHTRMQYDGGFLSPCLRCERIISDRLKAAVRKAMLLIAAGKEK